MTTPCINGNNCENQCAANLEICETTQFDECSKIDKAFFQKLNENLTIIQNNFTSVFSALCCKVPGVNGATIAINGLEAGQNAGVGAKNITGGIVYQDDPDNILSFVSGGIRVTKAGLYLIGSEVGTSVGGGFLESSIFINGVNNGLGFPNSGSDAAKNTLGSQYAVLRLEENDLVKTGVGNNDGATSITVANLAVTFLSE